MNGMCSSKIQNGKKIPKTTTFENTTNLCIHMKTVGDNLENIKALFLEYFESD